MSLGPKGSHLFCRWNKQFFRRALHFKYYAIDHCMRISHVLTIHNNIYAHQNHIFEDFLSFSFKPTILTTGLAAGWWQISVPRRNFSTDISLFSCFVFLFQNTENRPERPTVSWILCFPRCLRLSWDDSNPKILTNTHIAMIAICDMHSKPFTRQQTWQYQLSTRQHTSIEQWATFPSQISSATSKNEQT